QQAAHRDDQRQVLLERAPSVDRHVLDAVETLGGRRRRALRRERRLETARALELYREHALSATRRLERDAERHRRATDAALADDEDELPAQEIGEAHRAASGRQLASGGGQRSPPPLGSNRRNTRHALVPPNPNEFEIATSKLARRAWLGT